MLASNYLDTVQYSEVKKYLLSSFNKLEDASSIDNNQILISILEKNLDFDNISKAVLGRSDMDLAEEKLQKFHSLYKDYLVKVYIEKLQLINLKDGKLEIESVIQDTKDENMFIVIARFIDKENTMINMNAVITKKMDDFMIFDIAVENVSIIASHRVSFAHNIESNGGIDVLLDQLEKKIKE